jgi:hypothetical protein
MDIPGIDLSRLSWPQQEVASLETLLAFVALKRNEKNGRMHAEVMEDLMYLSHARQDFEDDPQLRGAVISAISEVALNLEEAERLNRIRRTSGLISFAHESHESYDPWRGRRLCRLAADTVDATPLSAPVVISKLRWKLRLHHDSGVNREGARPEQAQFELIRGLRNQVFQVVQTSRLAQVVAPLTEELFKGHGVKLIETAFSEVLQAGVELKGSRDRVLSEDEALLSEVLKRIGETVIVGSALSTFSEREINVLSPLFAQVSTEFRAAARALLRAQLKPSVSAEFSPRSDPLRHALLYI